MITLYVIAFIASYLLIAYSLRKLVTQSGIKRMAHPIRIKFIHRCTQLGVLIMFVMVGSILLGIGYGQISLFFSSIFAVIGVALFAQWSLLSNVTASFLIFFGFPFRPGDHIRVIEADNDISGIISEIGLLYTVIKHDSGNLISYPNNLLMQRPVIASPSKNNVLEHHKIVKPEQPESD